MWDLKHHSLRSDDRSLLWWMTQRLSLSALQPSLNDRRRCRRKLDERLPKSVYKSMWELDQCQTKKYLKKRKASKSYRNLILILGRYMCEKMVVNISSHSMLYSDQSQTKSKCMMELHARLWTLCLKDSTAPFLHMVKLVLVKHILWLESIRTLNYEVSYQEL